MIINKNLIHKAFIVLILLASLSPKLNAIDNVSIRWFLISLCSTTYFFFNKRSINKYVIFFLIALIVPIFLIDNNIEQYLLTYSKYSLLIITFNFLVNSLARLKSPLLFISNLFVISLAVESLVLLQDYIIDPTSFTGISMNRNISSFSILLKLPIVIYRIYFYNDSKIKKIIFNTIQYTSIISVIILQSRLAISLLMFMYFIIILRSRINKKRLIIPFFSIIACLLLLLKSSNSILSSKQFLPSNIYSDTSLLQRLDYVSNAVRLIKEKPFLGNGLGSWKVESLRFSEHGNSDVVIPYYVHNDFLQIFVELGILGVLLYLSFFLFILKLLLRNKNEYDLNIFLFLSLFIFFINSNFNFPLNRPQEIIPFLIVAAIITACSQKSFINIKLKSIGLLPILFILLSTVIISLKEHQSLVVQKTLLNDYYNKTYSGGFDNFSKINYKFPSLASNTIPISTLLARYSIEENKMNETLKLIEYSDKVNSYDILTKQLKLRSNLELGDFVSALTTSRELFGLNNQNLVYADIFFTLSASLQLNQNFELSDIILTSDELDIHKSFYKNYLLLENYNIEFVEKLIEISNNKFPSENFFNELINSIK